MANKTLLNPNQIKNMDEITQDLAAAKTSITTLSETVGTLSTGATTTAEQINDILEELTSITDNLSTLAGSMPNFTVLDHAPTQAEIDAAAEGAIIMTYDPADVYTPE